MTLEERAHNLDQAGARFGSSPGTRRTWAEGMSGKPAEDRLGLKLPTFVTAERALAWTDQSPLDVSAIKMLAARAWPGVAARWLVLVGVDTDGSDDGGPALEVRLAIVDVAVNPSVEPSIQRVARTLRPIQPRPQWSLLPASSRPRFEADCPDLTRCPEDDEPLDLRPAAFDFASYDLGFGERAFGLRFRVSEGYSGGFAVFEALSLLRVEGDRITPVLDVPVAAHKMTAADWNPDGTRQHDVYLVDLVLLVRRVDQARSSLVLKSTGTASPAITFAWNAEQAAFSCQRQLSSVAR